jgi:hypothetical protein
LELMLKETTVFHAGVLGPGRRIPPQKKQVSITETKLPVNMTLYGGSSHTAELSCLLSPAHTTTTLNAARHIDVTYTFCITQRHSWVPGRLLSWSYLSLSPIGSAMYLLKPLAALGPHLAYRSCQQQVRVDIRQYPPALIPAGLAPAMLWLLLSLPVVLAVTAWPMSSVPHDRPTLLLSPHSSHHRQQVPHISLPVIPRLRDDLTHLVEVVALLLPTYNHRTCLSLHLHQPVNDQPMPPDQDKVQELPSDNGRLQKKRRCGYMKRQGLKWQRSKGLSLLHHLLLLRLLLQYCLQLLRELLLRRIRLSKQLGCRLKTKNDCFTKLKLLLKKVRDCPIRLHPLHMQGMTLVHRVEASLLQAVVVNHLLLRLYTLKLSTLRVVRLPVRVHLLPTQLLRQGQ